MSMIGNLFRVSSKEFDEILADSSVLENKIYSEDVAGSDDLLDLDKTWDALFYLLTGHSISELDQAKPPLSWTLFSGQIVDGDQDLGYGPAHYVTPDQVILLNKELESITRESLQKKYDGDKMNSLEIYPGVWDEPESVDYVLDNFDLMKDFYRTAEKNRMAVITFIN